MKKPISVPSSRRGSHSTPTISIIHPLLLLIASWLFSTLTIVSSEIVSESQATASSTAPSAVPSVNQQSHLNSQSDLDSTSVHPDGVITPWSHSAFSPGSLSEESGGGHHDNHGNSLTGDHGLTDDFASFKRAYLDNDGRDWGWVFFSRCTIFCKQFDMIMFM